MWAELRSIFRSGFHNRRSPEYLLIHGLPPEAADESHQDWVNRIHPDDREATEKKFLAAIAGKDEDYTVEYRIIRPSDGELRWIGVVAKIERDAGGHAIRLLGAHIDITDRMLAQQTLRESEQRFRLIADSAPVPIWVSSSTARVPSSTRPISILSAFPTMKRSSSTGARRSIRTICHAFSKSRSKASPR